MARGIGRRILVFTLILGLLAQAAPALLAQAQGPREAHLVAPGLSQLIAGLTLDGQIALKSAIAAHDAAGRQAPPEALRVLLTAAFGFFASYGLFAASAHPLGWAIAGTVLVLMAANAIRNFEHQQRIARAREDFIRELVRITADPAMRRPVPRAGEPDGIHFEDVRITR